jgi:hypothetical protein
MNRTKSSRIIVEKKNDRRQGTFSDDTDTFSSSDDKKIIYTKKKKNIRQGKDRKDHRDKEGKDNKEDHRDNEEDRFVSIVDSGYKKSKYGSKQDHMTGYDMVHQLDNYVALKTLKEKRILERVIPFKTWIRYLNINNKKFRVGGLLMKVEYPDYIMLVNPKLNLTWSVQLKDHIIYVPDKDYPRNREEREMIKIKRKELEKKKEKEEKMDILKDHLFSLYKTGKLTLKKKG